MLGFSTNFEGWPAIAAARVIAKLSAGELALEQSVWDFPALQRHCGEEKELQGKHAGEAFRVHLHQRLQFPTNLPPAPPVELPDEEPKPLQISAHGEFAHTVKQRIATLLHE